MTQNGGTPAPVMLSLLLLSFPLSTSTGTMDVALSLTEAPNTLRAAFTLKLESPLAERIIDYDPRREEGKHWMLVSETGADTDLDKVLSEWSSSVSPDGWLFPDELRSSLGGEVDAEIADSKWRIGFQHTPSNYDSSMDVWAAEQMQATGWIDPYAERFERIDYTISEPIRGPEGGRIRKYHQSYYFETEPAYGMSYVSGVTIELEARAAWKTIRRSYSAQVLEAEFFFASAEAEKAFVEKRHIGTGENP